MSNEHRLEQIIQEQRLQMFFASRLWFEARKENDRLRQTIAELQTLLEAHGIAYRATTENSDNQLSLPFEASHVAGWVSGCNQ